MISTLGESFFGYYDTSPTNETGQVLFHETISSTKKKPCSHSTILLGFVSEGRMNLFAETFAYNWQQSARMQWLNDAW